MTDEHKTSKRIKFATDEWGNRDVTHLEIEWNNQTLRVTITDEKIHIVGPLFVANQTSANALDIVLGIGEEGK